MTLQIGYAYPTSEHAKDVGREDVGAYVVTRITNARTGQRLKTPKLATREGFATREAAEAWLKERAGLIVGMIEEGAR